MSSATMNLGVGQRLVFYIHHPTCMPTRLEIAELIVTCRLLQENNGFGSANIEPLLNIVCDRVEESFVVIVNSRFLQRPKK